MRTLRLLGLLALLCPQLARAQAAPADPPSKPAAPAASAPAKPSAPKPATKPAKAAPAKPSAEAEVAPPAPPPVAPAAPPGAFPQGAPPPPPPFDAPEAQQGPVQPQGGYPYGYGYGYVPPPVDPQRQKTLHALQKLDLRIASVRKQQRQYSVVGPAVMTGSGYLVAAGFGVAAIASYFLAEDIREGDCSLRYNRGTREYEDRCDVNNNGVVTDKDEDAARTLARTFGAISAIGAGLGIAGTVLLMKQLGKRRQYQPELYDLHTRRGQLLQQLRWGGGYSSNGATLTLTGKF